MAHVRRAVESDRGAILELARMFLGESIFGTFFPFSAKHVGELFDLVMGSPGIIFVLEEDLRDAGSPAIVKQVVGMLVAVPLRDAYSGKSMCDEIAWYVRPEHRKGVGGVKLLKALENWARQKQLSLITMVAPTGTEVGAFYERLGYSPIETKFAKRL